MNNKHVKFFLCIVLTLCFALPNSVLAAVGGFGVEEGNLIAKNASASICVCGQQMEESNRVIENGNILYDSYYCHECDAYTPRDFIGLALYAANNIANQNNRNAEVPGITTEESISGIICDCGGSLYYTGELGVINGIYTIVGTKSCIVPPHLSKDGVWRFYYYKIMRCTGCLQYLYVDKTQYYKDCGYCNHTGIEGTLYDF